ncbi:MAG: DUF1501 domain-containing protein [Gemmataceae bacterium]
MLNLLAPRTSGRTCDGIARRDFLRIGALGLGGLTLADLLRLRAAGSASKSHKAAIMIYLPGGPSHIDMYDLKPDAPVEYRGEFSPIRTSVPGIHICELMPQQAKIADKFAILRGLRTRGNHDPTELLTGVPAAASGRIGQVRRPCFGSVLSKLRGHDGPIPPYVSVSSHKLLQSYDDPEEPAYLGPAHKPFSLLGQTMKDLAALPDISRARQQERMQLLKQFDTLRRDIDTSHQLISGLDSYQRRALEMIASPAVRDALDLDREPERLRACYGPAGADLLRARRLVEAGVSVVSVAARFSVRVGTINDPGGWDTHGNNFKLLRAKLPIYDQAVAALITDLHERGQLDDVAVVIWGEFGRTPRIGDSTKDGRGHWPSAGCALLAGGGLRTGQLVGETDARAEKPRFRAYTPQHVLATLYHVFGIDLDTTLPDHNGRPQYLLDRTEKIASLI